MVNAFDFLNPMNQSVYMESMYPSNKQEVLQYMEGYTPRPQNLPMLRQQPVSDSWYYKNDGLDDGKISLKEKLKAFVKGGTYNLVKGMFCDKDGFSFKRTFSTLAIAGAIGMCGPIGIAAAGALGLAAGTVKFANASELAKNSTSDIQTRAAYEGYGEGTSLSLLSLFGGLKGLKAIKNNFAFAKSHPNLKVNFFDRFLKWDASKYAVIRPNKPDMGNIKPVQTLTEDPIVETPVTDKPAAETTAVKPKPKRTRKPSGKKTTISKKPKKTELPKNPQISFLNPKEWHGEKIDVQIPNIEVCGESTPLGQLPSPIGVPNNQIWLP